MTRAAHRSVPRNGGARGRRRGRHDRTCRRRAARSASVGSRRPSRTTCAGSPTAGRRWTATGARSCCTRPSTTPRSGRSGVDGARKVVDLWAERTAALGARADVSYVLVFENRGRRGRCDDRPSARSDLRLRPRPVARQACASTPAGDRMPDPGERAVADHGRVAGVGAVGPDVPASSSNLAPDRAGPRPAVVRRHGPRRAGRRCSIDVLERLDRLYGQPLPYMMWLNQRPTVERRLRRRLVQHRDRVAVARRRRAALHRRRRGRRRGVLQPRRPRATRRPPPLIPVEYVLPFEYVVRGWPAARTRKAARTRLDRGAYGGHR